MPDHFVVLAQPRRPWLDAGGLKDAFHRAVAEQHPDVSGGSDKKMAEVNAAYAVLSEPAARLRHFLELEAPVALASPAPIPPALATHFTRIAALRRDCAAWQKKQNTILLNPLSAALIAFEKPELQRGLEAALLAIEETYNAALDELRRLDDAWLDRDDHTFERLAALQQEFAFLAKWQAQLREDLFKLSA